MNVVSNEKKESVKKMDLQRVKLALSFGVALLVGFPSLVSAAGRSKDGAAHAPAHGRAVFTLEDMKALLGLKSRDPSSTHVLAPKAALLSLRLTDSERQHLTRQIRKIDTERDALKVKITKENKVKKTEIRAKRMAIQNSRLSAKLEADSSIGKSLFDNLLAEGNLEAQSVRKLSEFDAAHLFVIEYHEAGAHKQVDTVVIGKNVVWNSAGTLVAKK